MSEMIGDGVTQARPADAEIVRSVFRAVPDAILVVDPDGVVRMANDSAERLFGGVLIGMAVEELMPTDARHAHIQSRRAYARKPKMRDMSASPNIRGLRLDGTEFLAEISLSPVEVEEQRWTVCAVRDVTERRAMEEKLRDMSLKDALTGLYNRRFLELQLEHLAKGRRPIGTIVLDLDDLKTVNDALGHGVGDQLIKTMGKKLRSILRGDDVVCRVGGDEFAALLPGVSQVDLQDIEKRLRRLSSEATSGSQILRFSFGATWCDQPPKIREALADADAAMYRNKRSRKWQRQSLSLEPGSKGQHLTTDDRADSEPDSD